jgi:hypothetical protein
VLHVFMVADVYLTFFTFCDLLIGTVDRDINIFLV